MALLEKELEKQLMDAGGKLLSPPSSVPELLALLDRVEKYLTRVEQSPSESMNKALSPSKKALIAGNLLRHSNVDVRVAIASCISEITRITAPDAPYDDDQMKEVFRLIVSSFEKLDDKSSPSYVKRTTILETVAKVRSCVVMLDLECDALIVEMFQHFLRSIRDDHPENVFSSMETIMTLILEESEDVPLDLVSSILDFLKIENKEALPIARQLGEKVIDKCASKLKPYLLPAIKSRGASLNDYSKVVANVCQMASETVEPSDGDAASKNLADESDLGNTPTEKAVEVAMESLDDAPPSEEVGATAPGSPKSVVSNGTVQKEIEDTSAGPDDTKQADNDNHDEVKTSAEPSKANVDSHDDGEHAKPQAKPEKSNSSKRKGRRTSALKSSSKPSESTLAGDKKETDKVPVEQEKGSVDAGSTHSKDAVVDDAGPAADKREPDVPASPPKTLENEKQNENETADVSSPSPIGSLADESRSTKVGQGKNKDKLVQENVPASDTVSKKESDPQKTSERTDGSESETHKRTGMIASTEPDKEKHIRSPVFASKKDDGNKSNLDAKSAKQFGKKIEVISGQSRDKKRREQGKGTSSKDLAKTPSKDNAKKPLPKSTEKSSKDGSDLEKSSKTSSKRKRSPDKGKASGTKGYGEELVGSKIEVWWPADKKFYKGVVESFDSVKTKHKIVYDDGDVEILKLAKEKWKLIEEHSLSDQEPKSDDETPDEASEMPKEKKAKTSEEPKTKAGKAETATKKGAGSMSKSKATPKSVHMQKDDSKEDAKPREESSKSAAKTDQGKGGKSKDLKAGNKSFDDTPKPVGKSNDNNLETPKAANKSKQETPKGASKSKGKSPKTNSKTDTKDTGKVDSDLSSKGEEEEAEGTEKSPEPTKGLDTAKGKSSSASKSLKSGKKRKRGGRS